MVKAALDVGYRHVDTVECFELCSSLFRSKVSWIRPQTTVSQSQGGNPIAFSPLFFAIGNEESVGRALRESNVPRHEIFLTTKLE